MTVDLFFKNNKKEDVSCYPVYHDYEIPEKFATVTWNKLKNMSYEDFHVLIEEMRVWMLEMYEVHNINTHLSPATIKEIKAGFKKFVNMDVSKYYHSGEIQGLYGSSNKWTSGLNNWFPEMLGVEVSHSSPKSVIDLLKKVEYFHHSMDKIILEDTLKNFRKSPDIPCFRMIRKILSVTRGTQMVTNFPTHVAKWLYIHYLSEIKDKTLYVYDPCMGWAGRMVSLFAASSHISLHDKKIKLIGTDVNTAVHARFDKIYKFWDTYVSSLKNVSLSKYVVPAEDMGAISEFQKLNGKGHLAFTSPPYFDKELYSQDETQSYIRYKKYPEWRDGFLQGLLKTTYDYLRPGGTFLLNVANTRPRKDGTFIAPIENDSVEIGESLGYRYDGKYYLLLSLLAGKGNKINKNIITVDGVEWKFEPIHIFTKK
jgi:hypothetical protein